MKGIIISILALVSGMTCSAFEGIWRGELSVGPNKLPIVFNFSEDWAGQTRCTLDSPLQGAKGIPTTVKYCKNDSISLKINSIGASFTGRISHKEITGVFSQRGMDFDLVLTPEKSLQQRRPQTPIGPFPYTTIDTTFVSEDGTVLAGTLTLPAEMKKKTPAVVFITGSGPQNRDEELFDHRPFAVIADYLARNGIASLRYDDRGVGQSKGDFSTADFDILKADAESAIKLLRGVKRLGRVGVIGHSEGGTIALSLAADGKVDFAVSLAGAIAPGDEIIIAQNLHAIEPLGLSDKQKEDFTALLVDIYYDVINGKDVSESDVDELVSSANLDIPSGLLSSVKRSLPTICTPAYRKMLDTYPDKWIGKIKVPIFALNGTLDTQVLSQDNLWRIDVKLKKSKTKEYPGLNHLFQHAITGEVTEYNDIEETISPEVLDDILKFILSVK